MRVKPDASTECRELGVFLSSMRNQTFPNVGADILSVRIGFPETHLGLIERGVKLLSEEAMEVLIKELRLEGAERIRGLRLLARAKVAATLTSDLRKIYDDDVVRSRTGPLPSNGQADV